MVHHLLLLRLWIFGEALPFKHSAFRLSGHSYFSWRKQAMNQKLAEFVVGVGDGYMDSYCFRYTFNEADGGRVKGWHCHPWHHQQSCSSQDHHRHHRAQNHNTPAPTATGTSLTTHNQKL